MTDEQKPHHSGREGMSSETTAEVVATPTDNRPEPPAAFPDQWATVSWLWLDQTDKWVAFAHGSHDTRRDAEKQAQYFIEEGHRNVRIVRIPGEQAAREGEGGK